jgi:hypothetical protein
VQADKADDEPMMTRAYLIPYLLTPRSIFIPIFCFWLLLVRN